MSTIILINPRFPHNVGAAVRAAACYGFDTVLFTGSRVKKIIDEDGRLPREERLREYQSVDWHQTDRPFDELPSGVTPVAVELVPGAEYLPYFEHPEKVAYVFGPEDGTLDRGVLGQCHRFVRIPSRFCLNLAAAVNVVLYDRLVKLDDDAVVS